MAVSSWKASRLPAGRRPVQRGPVPSGLRQSRYKRLCRKKIDADDPRSHRGQGNFPETNSHHGRHGGFDLELLIPNGAPLGQYRVTLDFRESDRTLYAPLFRMEEYKKPEFTVKMDAPDKPLRLGQPIPVSVQADYYAGGPVNEGKATITITRTLGADVWTPYWKWSWLYSRESSPYYIYFTPDPPLTDSGKNHSPGQGRARPPWNCPQSRMPGTSPPRT